MFHGVLWDYVVVDTPFPLSVTVLYPPNLGVDHFYRLGSLKVIARHCINDIVMPEIVIYAVLELFT